jgi:hypothetical protein
MDEGSPAPDILEQGSRPRRPRLPSSRWRPSRGATILAAVTLAIGLAAGYAAGHGQGPGTVAAPAPAAPAGRAPRDLSPGTTVTGEPPAPAGSGPALTQNPGTCSVQAGRDLELGIPVTNQSGETVLLESVKPVPPVAGLLKVLSWRWAPCGFDHDATVPDTVAIGPGETTWVTAVVQPLVACPGPAPLQFQVTYSINRHQVAYSINRQKSTVNLPGFPDLSAVPYSGCPTPAA